MSTIVLEKLKRINKPENTQELRDFSEQLRRILDQIEKYLKQLDDNKQDA